MCRPEVYVTSGDFAATTMTSQVQLQLLADLQDAVRKFPAAICEINDLRGETQYLVCNFPGLDVKALYEVTTRYTDTEIVTEPSGSGQDRYVIKSKHTASVNAGSAAWWISWLTLRNVITILLTLASLSNLWLTSPIVAQFFTAAPANLTVTTPPTNSSVPNGSTKPSSGFTIF